MLSNYMKNCQLFKHLNQSTLNHLIHNYQLKSQKYHMNETLFFNGDDCHQVSILLKGKVLMESISPSGKMFIVRQVEPNEIFGEGLVFSTPKKFPVNVVSGDSETLVLHISKPALLGMFREDENILTAFINMLSNKMLFLNQKVRLLALNSIKEKITLYLLEQYKQIQTLKIPIKGSKKKLSDLLAIPRPSLSRELIKMKTEGIIDYDRHFIYILDLEALENILY